MSQQTQNIQTPLLDEIKKNAGLTIAVGVVVMLIGILVMATPLIAGMSVALMIGIMLLVGGIAQTISAIKNRMGLFAIIVGVLTIIAGGYLTTNMDAALATLTFILAAYLIISGVSEVMMALQARPVDGWGWALFSGILSVILGIMIWAQMPLSGAWAIGILIGIRLLFSGWALVMFGMAARGAGKA